MPTSDISIEFVSEKVQFVTDYKVSFSMHLSYLNEWLTREEIFYGVKNNN